MNENERNRVIHMIIDPISTDQCVASYKARVL